MADKYVVDLDLVAENRICSQLLDQELPPQSPIQAYKDDPLGYGLSLNATEKNYCILEKLYPVTMCKVHKIATGKFGAQRVSFEARSITNNKPTILFSSIVLTSFVYVMKSISFFITGKVREWRDVHAQLHIPNIRAQPTFRDVIRTQILIE